MNAVNQKQKIKEFIERWQAAEGNEDREARSFLIKFIEDVLGFSDATRVVDFERRVKGRKIDAFYEDMGILIEAKSRKPGILDEPRDNGKYGLETPYQQAKWYANELPASIKPRWIIVTDFDEFRIHDLDTDNPEKDYITVRLEELAEPASLAMFGFFHDKSQSRLIKEKELSVEAGEIVGKLYDAFSKQYLDLETSKEEQRSLNVLIVRLVFLLYAEDAELLQEHQAFYKYMKKFSAEQSRQALIDLFKILDTPEERRDRYANPDLLAFPYVNGELFKDESIIIPQFTDDLRVELLLNASAGFDWKDISPTIFGAVFESTLNPETRRAGGMHYTSIENIHKVIDPLFLDDLKTELAEIEGEKIEKKRKLELRAFQKKLGSLNIFDPACGSGNFLTESYVQLRRLENRCLENLQEEGQARMSFGEDFDPIEVSIKQFYGIEINDFAVSVAKTALWIAESQMLTETQDLLMLPLDFLPLTTNAHIVEGNALRMDWNNVLPAEDCSYIIGNPPFVGARLQTPEQKADTRAIFSESRSSGVIDYVANWYAKAIDYITQDTKCAFVSTNSISQGEQVAAIWKQLIAHGLRIDFAYLAFVWNSEASDQAHVHVVIIGFSKNGNSKRRIFSPNGSVKLASNINGYLSDAPDAFVDSRNSPIGDVHKMVRGGGSSDWGYLMLDEDEKALLVSREPQSEKWIRPYMQGYEFINGVPRYCLWLLGCNPDELTSMPLVNERVQSVRNARLESKKASTRKKADTPWLFDEIINVDADFYIAVPQVSSQRRAYVPMGYVPSTTIAGNKLLMVPGGTKYEFGVLSSQFHNAWMRLVAGRMKSDYQYSATIVYNNFVFPNPTAEQRAAIEQAAQAVIEARETHPGWTLADLYDPDKMPADLLDAHKSLDAAVEAAYGVDCNGDEEKIVAHLFKLYAEATKEG